MTTQMILALSITILMIVMIMSDKFSFGAPPMVACCLLVLTGVSTIERAFAGFINSSVIMIAGFMAVMAALQKTSLMSRIKSLMANLASKGGFKAYASRRNPGAEQGCLAVPSALPQRKGKPGCDLVGKGISFQAELWLRLTLLQGFYKTALVFLTRKRYYQKMKNWGGCL